MVTTYFLDMISGYVYWDTVQYTVQKSDKKKVFLKVLHLIFKIQVFK